MLSACSESDSNSGSSGQTTSEADADSGMDANADMNTDSGMAANSDADADTDPSDVELTVRTEARYRLTFNASWSAETHPVDFPGASAHFSGLIGAVHNEQVIFWEPGQISTDGIERMAETGGTSLFRTEIEAAMAAGSASSIISGAGVGTSPGSVSVEIDVNSDYPQITLVSMIAPSPDWFIGVHNLSLLDNGEFVQSMTVDLVAYDSGTDSGLQYRSADEDTVPRDPIASVSSEPTDTSFVDGRPFVGQFVLERLF